jgi:cell division transport system permease protein
MRAIDYALRQGWLSLWRTRGATSFAVIAIALALVVLGALLLVTWNTQRVVARLGAAAEFSIYLRDDASSDQRGAIESALDGSGLTAAREYVSKQQALSRFRTQFTDLAALTSDLGDNPFPASIEVRVRPDADAEGEVDRLVAAIARMPGVDDVRHDRQWLARFGSGMRAAGAAGLTLAIVMAIAAAVTVAAVVRLGLQARSDEIEIMELVGAPLTFIRGPFIAEGLLQGGIGALVALVVLWVGYLMARNSWGASLASVFDGASLEFLPVSLSLALVAGGMVVGSAGGFVAARYAGTGTPGR